jgi:zinc transport system ATP-binding protein
MSEALIAAANISVSAGGSPILDSVSLAVYRGEIVTLIGPNGSGKTTLIKAIMGMMPAAGKIVRRRGLKIGYVPQYFLRDPCLPISVAGFLALFAPASANETALARTGIAAAANKQISALSGGELARVLLARAIAGHPDLLVLDEPTASVDVSGEAEFYHLIGELRSEIGCGVLLISHDLHVVMARSTRVICLNRHICCEGTASAVLQHPAFRELFGQEAGELALYSHHHRFIHAVSGELIPKHD